jgi:hypothetical protein
MSNSKKKHAEILADNKKTLQLYNEIASLKEQIKSIQKDSYEIGMINALREDSANLKDIKTKYKLKEHDYLALQTSCEIQEKDYAALKAAYQDLKAECENEEILKGDRNIRIEDAIEYIKRKFAQNNPNMNESDVTSGVISMVEHSSPTNGGRRSRRHRRTRHRYRIRRRRRSSRKRGINHRRRSRRRVF